MVNFIHTPTCTCTLTILLHLYVFCGHTVHYHWLTADGQHIYRYPLHFVHFEPFYTCTSDNNRYPCTLYSCDHITIKLIVHTVHVQLYMYMTCTCTYSTWYVHHYCYMYFSPFLFSFICFSSSSLPHFLLFQAMRLSNKARRTRTVGEIVNLMSVDAQRFMDLMTYINLLWSAPFQIVLSLIFLYQAMGWSIFAGVGVMVLMIPINAVFATASRKFQVSSASIRCII